jgi:hypothetical protein
MKRAAKKGATAVQMGAMRLSIDLGRNVFYAAAQRPGAGRNPGGVIFRQKGGNE